MALLLYTIACVSVALGAASAAAVGTSLDNGQGATPPMGMNPWTAFRTNFSQALLLEVAHTMARNGLQAAGYNHINLDCGWTTGFRDGTSGRLQVDAVKFPDMPGFVRELHALGFKFGMCVAFCVNGGLPGPSCITLCAGFYVLDAWHPDRRYAGGPSNSSRYGSAAQCCHRRLPGANDSSWGHFDVDAAHFKELAISYLKSDPCVGHPAFNATAPLTAQEIFIQYNEAWVTAFAAIGYEDKVFLQGSGPTRACGTNVSSCAAIPRQLNSWRTTGDVKPTFASVMSNIQHNDAYASLAGPHHWNDADMLQCGQPNITGSECRVNLALWSIAKSPLLIGADVREFGEETLALLTNREVLRVSQDPLGEQGQLVVAAGTHNNQTSVWAGRLAPRGSLTFAAVLVNLDDSAPVSIELSWEMLPGSVPRSTP
jgi:alpha-galactosidase